MRNKIVLLMAVVVAATLFAIVTVAQTNTTLKFPRGKSSTTVKGTLKPDLPNHYYLRAKGGQTMNVRATAVKVSIYPSGQTNTLDGADSVANWNGELPDDGEYVITVMPEARRTAYTLQVSIK